MKNIFKHIFKRGVDGTSAVGSIFGNSERYSNAMTLSAFYGAVELISNSIAQLPIIIRDSQGKVDVGHPLNQLFNGNTLPTKFHCLKNMVVDAILKGNGFGLIERGKDGQIQLEYIESGQVTINYNNLTKEPPTYTIQGITGVVPDADVIHIYRDSRNGVDGISILEFGRDIVRLSGAANQQAIKYFEQACSLYGMITSSHVINSQQKENLRKAFNEAHGMNGSGIIIADPQTTFTPMSSDTDNTQMLESRKFSVEEICRIFNLNPSILSGTEFDVYQFVNMTLLPYISIIEEQLNTKVGKLYGVTIDLDETYFLRSDKNTISNYYSTLVSKGLMTVNEAREGLNLPKIDDYEGSSTNSLIIPYTNINQNTLINSQHDKNDEEII